MSTAWVTSRFGGVDESSRQILSPAGRQCLWGRCLDSLHDMALGLALGMTEDLAARSPQSRVQ